MGFKVVTITGGGGISSNGDTYSHANCLTENIALLWGDFFLFPGVYLEKGGKSDIQDTDRKRCQWSYQYPHLSKSKKTKKKVVLHTL